MIARPGPTLFYYSSDFEGERSAPVLSNQSRKDFQIIGTDEATRWKYESLLKTIGFERYGRLIGEYAFITSHLLVDRHGCGTLINVNGDDFMATGQMIDFWESQLCQDMVANILAQWDSIPVLHDSSVLGEPYSWNYFHFSTLLLPKARFFGHATSSVIGIENTTHPFQKSLLSLIIGERPIYPVNSTMRLVNPILAQSTSFQSNLTWLRHRLGTPVRRGGKRFYITRGSNSRSMSGAIQETPEFLALLKDFGFETVSFGGGDLGINDQLQLIQDAGLVLTSHGAHITNLTYMDYPISFIEVLPPLSRHLNLSVYMELAVELGFRYRGLVSQHYNRDGTLTIDLDALRQTLGELISD